MLGQPPQQLLSAGRVFKDMLHRVYLATHVRGVVQAQNLTGTGQQSDILEFLNRLVKCWRTREGSLADILAANLVLIRMPVQKQEEPDLVE